MYITTDAYFSPKYFTVHTFYGEKTCFCWSENKCAIFRYTSSDYAAANVLTAPALIKTVQCFAGRIFVICIPRGIYKLSRDLKFAILSKSAIGMGTVFYEVLTPRSEYLYLDNKQTMINKLLFKLSSVEIDSRKLSVCPLNTENVEACFMKVLISNDSTVTNLCIIAYELKIFTLINETAQIIYSSIHPIRDIIPVHKNSRISGLFLLTDTDVIIAMYSKDDTLFFEKICLGTRILAICANFSQMSEDLLWMVYSNDSKLFYAKKELMADDMEQQKVQDKSFLCLQFYTSEMILGLTEDKQLVEFSNNAIEETLSLKKNTFVKLHLDMLKGASLMVDKIYKNTRELHSLNERLTEEEDKLKRINLYAHKQKMRMYPKVAIKRIADQMFLTAIFNDAVPKHSSIVFNVKSEYRNLFCTKKVVDQETVIGVRIPETLAANFSRITIDLIAFKDEGRPWCLVKDYVVDPELVRSKKKKTRANHKFVESKILMLEDLLREGNISARKLSEIKKSVRKEFNDV